MRKLPNHFKDRHTFIVGDTVINGCQRFKIEELPKVCKQYKVPDPIREEVIKAWEENSTIPEDWAGLSKHEDGEVRLEVAWNGYWLESLVSDENVGVRRKVAQLAYGLDTLVNDDDWSVRREVALHGYGLDILISDKFWAVRAAIARLGYYGLETLVKDESWVVKLEVAKHNYGLDVLVNDLNNLVRDEAKYRLTLLNK